MFLKDYLIDLLEARKILKLENHDFNFNIMKYNKLIEENTIKDSDIKDFKKYYGDFVYYIARNREKIASNLILEMINEEYNVKVKVPYLNVHIKKDSSAKEIANEIKYTVLENYMALKKEIEEKQKDDILILDTFIENYFKSHNKFGIAAMKEIVKNLESEIPSKISNTNKDEKIFKKQSISNKLKNSLKKLL